MVVGNIRISALKYFVEGSKGAKKGSRVDERGSPTNDGPLTIPFQTRWSGALDASTIALPPMSECCSNYYESCRCWSQKRQSCRRKSMPRVEPRHYFQRRPSSSCRSAAQLPHLNWPDAEGTAEARILRQEQLPSSSTAQCWRRCLMLPLLTLVEEGPAVTSVLPEQPLEKGIVPPWMLCFIGKY